MSLFNRLVEVNFIDSNVNINTSQLKINFFCKKTTSKYANQAKIEIYNLNSNTFNLLSELETLVQVKAGYAEQNGARTIFIGQICKVYQVNRYPNRITVIELGDGIKETTQTRASFSFTNRTLVTTALSEVGRTLGLSLNIQSRSNKKFIRGYPFIGKVTKALDELTNLIGSTWNIQDNELQILDKDGVLNIPPVILERGLGVVKEPERLQDTEGKLINNVDKRGYTITLYLNNEFFVNGSVQSEIDGISGSFKIIEVIHNGSNFADDFFTTVEMIEN